ncbi:MAG: hypothetical protein LBJ73_04915 [Rickettsiales bacterium]|jgi:hypothetical protein|nr:hypothetical protein [Rickettsiales bacterium]
MSLEQIRNPKNGTKFALVLVLENIFPTILGITKSKAKNTKKIIFL